MCNMVAIRAETNTQFVQLHMYSNTKRVFRCTVNNFYCIFDKFNGISVIIFYVFLA